MATQKKFGVSQDSDLGKTPIAVKNVDPTKDYALMADEPDSCSLINTGSDVDLGEKLTYNCRTIPTVTSSLDNMYPSRVKTGVQYGVKMEEQLSVTDSENPSFREDFPIVCSITFRHPKNGCISKEAVDRVFARAISACLKTNSDGTVTTRFGDLMKGALKPTTGLTAVSGSYDKTTIGGAANTL